MESKKLSARVSAYRDAVVAARGAGVTWAQLAALFGAQPKYFAKVCTKAMSGGRYQPTEQLPLPARISDAVSKSSIIASPHLPSRFSSTLSASLLQAFSS